MNVSVKGREAAVEALKEKGSLDDIPEEVPLREEIKKKIPKSIPIEKPETGQRGRP